LRSPSACSGTSENNEGVPQTEAPTKPRDQARSRTPAAPQTHGVKPEGASTTLRRRRRSPRPLAGCPIARMASSISASDMAVGRSKKRAESITKNYPPDFGTRELPAGTRLPDFRGLPSPMVLLLAVHLEHDHCSIRALAGRRDVAWLPRRVPGLSDAGRNRDRT
jgi:hypothetical protein